MIWFNYLFVPFATDRGIWSTIIMRNNLKEKLQSFVSIKFRDQINEENYLICAFNKEFDKCPSSA